MTVREILLLGNPKLYDPSEEVTETELDSFNDVITDLHDTMMDFRETHGAGRAIAAPQIGVFKRLIYMHIDKPTVFINPQLIKKSEDMMLVLDDCMCFPDLLVRVFRHRSCTIRYRDEDWKECTLDLDCDLSELLQHEYDHLDGILAVQRAVDDKSFFLKTQRQFAK